MAATAKTHDWGEWRIPTKWATDEVLAMFGASRLDAGLHILRDRPGYSTGSLAFESGPQALKRHEKQERARARSRARIEAHKAAETARAAKAAMSSPERLARIEREVTHALQRYRHLAATLSNDRDFGIEPSVPEWVALCARKTGAFVRTIKKSEKAARDAAKAAAEEQRVAKQFAYRAKRAIQIRQPLGCSGAQFLDDLVVVSLKDLERRGWAGWD